MCNTARKCTRVETAELKGPLKKAPESTEHQLAGDHKEHTKFVAGVAAVREHQWLWYLLYAYNHLHIKYEVIQGSHNHKILGIVIEEAEPWRKNPVLQRLFPALSSACPETLGSHFSLCPGFSTCKIGVMMLTFFSKCFDLCEEKSLYKS